MPCSIQLSVCFGIRYNNSDHELGQATCPNPSRRSASNEPHSSCADDIAAQPTPLSESIPRAAVTMDRADCTRETSKRKLCAANSANASSGLQPRKAMRTPTPCRWSCASPVLLRICRSSRTHRLLVDHPMVARLEQKFRCPSRIHTPVTSRTFRSSEPARSQRIIDKIVTRPDR